MTSTLADRIEQQWDSASDADVQAKKLAKQTIAEIACRELLGQTRDDDMRNLEAALLDCEQTVEDYRLVVNELLPRIRGGQLVAAEQRALAAEQSAARARLKQIELISAALIKQAKRELHLRASATSVAMEEERSLAVLRSQHPELFEPEIEKLTAQLPDERPSFDKPELPRCRCCGGEVHHITNDGLCGYQCRQVAAVLGQDMAEASWVLPGPPGA